MRSSRYVAFVFVIALGAACRVSTDSSGEGPFVVSHGTFFGMCAGYCTSVLTIDSTAVQLVEQSRDPQRFPTRTRSLTLTDAEWERIRTFASRAGLESVAGTHGCPDCADGGGEWVELRMGADTVRSTYDFGRTLAPIAQLQDELRALRRRFPQS